MLKYFIIVLICCLGYIGILKYQNNSLKQENISLELSYKSNSETLKSLQEYQQKTNIVISENKKELETISNKISKTKEFINETNEDDIVMLFNATMDRLFAENNSPNKIH